MNFNLYFYAEQLMIWIVIYFFVTR